ncbi:sugar transferase [bacterium]|nr:sugar transferase [bacterium]
MYRQFIKRWIDFGFALVGLMVLLPVMAVLAILIKWDSPGPILFAQTRVGRGFKPFQFYKFRSMVINADQLGPGVTAGIDPRITRVGVWLRKTKLDELPQLFNVLKGEVALVGPRPELARYVDRYPVEYARILSVLPGITDYAAIEFRHEEKILNSYSNVDAAYIDIILPQKMALYQRYIDEMSFLTDVRILLRTFFRIIW